jgi:two-component system, sensor histidine kinase PdtaS
MDFPHNHTGRIRRRYAAWVKYETLLPMVEPFRPGPCYGEVLNNANRVMVELVRKLRTLTFLPGWARYLIAAAVLALFFGLRWLLESSLAGYPFILFWPAVMLCALLFQHGSGFVASIISSLLAVYFFIPPVHSFRIERAEDVVAVITFIAVSFLLAGITETLRHVVDRLDDAERKYKKLADDRAALFQEMNHRTKNNIQAILNIVAMEASTADAYPCREPLARIRERVNVIGRVHNALLHGDPSLIVDARRYIDDLISDLSLTHAIGVLITLRADADAFAISIDRAVTVGMIVTELVSNAYRYAFPEGCTGIISVEVRGTGDQDMVITVTDNGTGIPAGPAKGTGIGSRLIEMLATQIDGTVSTNTGPHGTAITVRVGS